MLAFLKDLLWGVAYTGMAIVMVPVALVGGLLIGALGYFIESLFSTERKSGGTWVRAFVPA